MPESGVLVHISGECGMFVMWCMSMSTVLLCVDVLSRGGIFILTIVMCW